MRRIARGGWLTLVVLLILSGPAFSQAGQQNGTLTVSGHTGQASVTQFNGHPYVAIDALARLMNGSLGYQGDDITLTLPGGASTAASQSASRTLSRDFLNAGIETMSDIREWRSSLLVAVDNGAIVTDAWMSDFQAPAAKNLRLASAAATTDGDRNVLQLLNKEFGHMQQLGNKVLAARKTRSYMTSDMLKRDPLDESLLKCAHALGEMAANGEFQDNGSCR